MERDIKYLLGLLLWLALMIVIVIIGTHGYALAGDTPPTPEATIQPPPTESGHPTRIVPPTEVLPPSPYPTTVGPPLPPPTALTTPPAPPAPNDNGGKPNKDRPKDSQLPTALPETGGVDRFNEPEWLKLTLLGSALAFLFLASRIVRWGGGR